MVPPAHLAETEIALRNAARKFREECDEASARKAEVLANRAAARRALMEKATQ